MNNFHYTETNQILNRQIEFVGKKIILTVEFLVDNVFLLQDISFEVFVENNIVHRVSTIPLVFSSSQSSLLLVGAVGKSLSEIISNEAPLHVVILKDWIDEKEVVEDVSMPHIAYQPVCLLVE